MPDDDSAILLRNFVRDAKVAREIPSPILFWDETLRDGEQMPGVVFSPEEKLEIAKLMDEVGIFMTNGGIPVVSKKEMEAVKLLVKEGFSKMRILAAARTLKGDVDAVIESGAPEIAIFVACSDLHLKYKLRMTREQVLDASVKMIEHAKSHGLTVNFVTEDTVRADPTYVDLLYNAALDAKADRLVFCDTVGVMSPSSMFWWIHERRKALKRRVPLCIHCHNDFGMAVANELAAIEAGVQIPHTCINGLGERAGNAAFEDLAAALHFLYGIDLGFKMEKLYELSRKVEEISGIPVGVSKPVIGYNAFSHESGIHTHGIIKHQLTYEPIQPEQVGMKRKFVYGKHTGTASVEERLKSIGLVLEKEQLVEVANRIKALAESRGKKDVQEFIRTYREYEEVKKGVQEEEVFAIARQVKAESEKRKVEAK
ncbi:MAG TPA: homoaconitate hydratase [Thermoplasmata archaeon]|nr:homoaconitate hydratase [Thermoplasmata archaeon]